jgi:hypothetical protein
MSIVAWNCRGLGNLRVIPKIKFLVWYYKPDILFLCETIVEVNKIEEFRYHLGYDSCFAPVRSSRGRGFALFWRNTVNCSIVNYSANHISAKIEEVSRRAWIFTGFYGYPETARRRDSWNFIRGLARQISLPWCLMGDFNDILHADEKKGRTTRQIGLLGVFVKPFKMMASLMFIWKGILLKENRIEEWSRSSGKFSIFIPWIITKFKHESVI